MTELQKHVFRRDFRETDCRRLEDLVLTEEVRHNDELSRGDHGHFADAACRLQLDDRLAGGQTQFKRTRAAVWVLDFDFQGCQAGRVFLNPDRLWLLSAAYRQPAEEEGSHKAPSSFAAVHTARRSHWLAARRP